MQFTILGGIVENKKTIREWVLILMAFFKSTKQSQTPQKAVDPRHCAEDMRSNWERWSKNRRLVTATIGRGDKMHNCIVCDNPMVDLTKRVLLQEDIQNVIHPLPVQSKFGPEGHLVWAHWSCMHFYLEGLKSPWSLEMNVKVQITLDGYNGVRFEDQAFKKAQSEIERLLQRGIDGINISVTEVNKVSAQELSR
jgi:hypothetical protein